MKARFDVPDWGIRLELHGVDVVEGMSTKRCSSAIGDGFPPGGGAGSHLGRERQTGRSYLRRLAGARGEVGWAPPSSPISRIHQIC